MQVLSINELELITLLVGRNGVGKTTDFETERV